MRPLKKRQRLDADEEKKRTPGQRKEGLYIHTPDARLAGSCLGEPFIPPSPESHGAKDSGPLSMGETQCHAGIV